MKPNRQFLALSLIVTFGLLSLASCKGGRTVEAARENRSAAVSAADQDFSKKATEANLTEIDIARVALQKSDNSDVRDYANMIQSDHTAALEDITDLMKEKGVPEPKTLAADTRRDVDRMSGLSGPEFDREFVNMMVADHQKAVELFRRLRKCSESSREGIRRRSHPQARNAPRQGAAAPKQAIRRRER